jgi:hypothetical protein
MAEYFPKAVHARYCRLIFENLWFLFWSHNNRTYL